MLTAAQLISNLNLWSQTLIVAATENTVAKTMANLTSHLATYFLIYGQGMIERSNSEKMTEDPEGLFLNDILFPSLSIVVQKSVRCVAYTFFSKNEFLMISHEVTLC
jgi:hypothetical protein